jgi:hypothetical protein
MDKSATVAMLRIGHEAIVDHTIGTFMEYSGRRPLKGSENEVQRAPVFMALPISQSFLSDKYDFASGSAMTSAASAKDVNGGDNQHEQ